MLSWLEIIRPLNCAMATLGAAIGAVLVAESLTPAIVLALAVVFLITGAGNTVNDYLDVESDRINRPKRPIPSRRISKRQALLLSAALFGSGIFIAYILNNAICLFLAVFNSVLLVVYSSSLQNKVLVGNMAIAYLVGSIFLFGGAAAGDITLPLLLMLLSGLATFAREIVKDLEDLEGDRRSFIKKMASKVKASFGDRFRVKPSGIKLKYKTIYAILFACFSLWMAVVISVIPYAWEILGFTYLVILVPTDALLILASLVLIRRRNYRFTSKLIKTGMFLGLLAFLAGTFF
jgi:geranylgeranylglycerol-phosphate geranylgeranyltransferase